MFTVGMNYDRNTNFTGLTSCLSKRVFSCDNVKILSHDVFENSFAGNLPKAWIQKIPKPQRAETIKEIFKGFSDMVKSFGESGYNPPKVLEGVLKKSGILSADKKIKFKYLGGGAYGNVYRMDGLADEKNADQYVIKIFKERGKSAKSNGVFAELNRGGLYWGKAAGKDTQMVKTFFGDLKAGFIVNKFIDNSMIEPKKIVNPKSIGLQCLDEDLKINIKGEYEINKIDNYMVDQGGLKISSHPLTYSKDARYIAKRLAHTPKDKSLQQWNAFFDAPEYKNNTPAKIALIESLDALNPCDRAICFNKMLESAKNQKEFRTSLVKNISLIPDDDFQGCFGKVWGNSSGLEKKELFEYFEKLPLDSRSKYLKEALVQKDLASDVVEQFVHLPKEKMPAIFNFALGNADDRLRVTLFRNLNFLPKEQRLEFAKKILQNFENPKIESQLEDKVYNLGLDSTKKFKEAYSYLISDAKDTTKIFITNKILKNLDNQSYVSGFKEIAQNSSDAVKFNLVSKLQELSFKSEAGIDDINFIYKELAKNVENENYLDYLKSSVKFFSNEIRGSIDF